MALSALLLLAGCWKLDDPSIDTTVIPFDNDWVGRDSVVVTTVTPYPELACPDDQPATFFIVHDEDVTEPVPVAIVFHSGAFDYVVDPSEDSPLEGTHYAGDDRLSADWAKERVFQLLGMWTGTPDPGEVHEGTLPAALADGGIAALYPGNCWGDLWHNFLGRPELENDVDLDEFYRNGLAFGSWMFRFLVDEEFALARGVTLPFTPDTAQIALLGLGDGGRVLPDLLPMLREESWSAAYRVKGVLLDSTPDDLTWYVENLTTEQPFYNGLARIFTNEGDLSDIGQYSVARWLPGASAYRPSRVLLVSSAADPQLPEDTVQAIKGWIEIQANPDAYDAWEMAGTGHVFSNRDLQFSRDVRSFLYQ